MAIDVGPLCIDRANNTGPNRTVVAKPNPSNAAGTITSVCIWAFPANNISGLEYAAFSADGNNLTTNGDTDGSGLTAIGETTHTSAGCDFTAFAISTGEYIGCYFTVGEIAIVEGGGSGMWHVGSTDLIPCTNTAFGFIATWDISLFATGEEPVTGRIMSSLVSAGGLVGAGGIAGQGGGLVA